MLSRLANEMHALLWTRGYVDRHSREREPWSRRGQDLGVLVQEDEETTEPLLVSKPNTVEVRTRTKTATYCCSSYIVQHALNSHRFIGILGKAKSEIKTESLSGTLLLSGKYTTYCNRGKQMGYWYASTGGVRPRKQTCFWPHVLGLLMVMYIASFDTPDTQREEPSRPSSEADNRFQPIPAPS